MSNRQAIVIRHVAFEDLGILSGVLTKAGYDFRYVEAGVDDFSQIAPLAADLLVVLGGPIGVYEDDLYPFITMELELLRQRLAADRPTLGICLGAQLMAKALGAEVFPSGMKEIGWSTLTFTEAGLRSPLGRLDGRPVLHWHGDTFDLPPGARHLALTGICAQQAFALGPNLLGLQFHAEIDPALGIERWLIGHSCELSGAKIDPRELRRQTTALGKEADVEQRRSFFRDWLARLHFPSA